MRWGQHKANKNERGIRVFQPVDLCEIAFRVAIMSFKILVAAKASSVFRCNT